MENYLYSLYMVALDAILFSRSDRPLIIIIIHWPLAVNALYIVQEQVNQVMGGGAGFM